MPIIARIDRESAKHLSSSQYENPPAVLTDIMLTRGEKIATLQRWRQQSLDELSAGDDGMPTRRTSGRSHQIIEEVEAALEQLADVRD